MTRLLRSAVVLGACLVLLPACGWIFGKGMDAPIPVTREDLRLMPESTSVALAIPRWGLFRARLVQFSKHLGPDTEFVDRGFDGIIGQMGELLGVDGVHTIEEIFAAKGVDGTAPMTLFIATESSDGDTRVALVFHYVDAETARTSLEEILQKSDRLEGVERHEVALGEVIAQVYDPEVCAYFLNEGRMVVSNSLEFLGEVAERVSDPADIKYGTKACPASAENEIVALIRGDHLFGGKEASAEDGDEETETRYLDALDSDPIVLTFAWEDDRLEVVARVDLAEHDRLRARVGKATPLRLAQFLPKGAIGFVSVRFNEEFKQVWGELGELIQGTEFDFGAFDLASLGDRAVALRELIDPASGAEGFASLGERAVALREVLDPSSDADNDRGAADEDPASAVDDDPISGIDDETLSGILKNLNSAADFDENDIIQVTLAALVQFAGLVDDEFSFAVSDSDTGPPRAMALLGIQDPSQVAQLLVLWPSTDAELFKNVEIKVVVIAEKLSLYHALVRDTLAVSTDLDDIRSTITHLLGRSDSGLFDSFTPPLDGDHARYAGFFVRSSGLSQLLQGLDEETNLPGMALARSLVGAFRDARVSADLDKTWLAGRLQIHFNPVPVAEAAVAEPAV